MQKVEHSPGPWERDDLLPPNGRPVIARTTGGIPISATTDDWLGSDREDEANAALIAAAPKMLKALEYYLELSANDGNVWIPDHIAILDSMVEAAVAEARGKVA